MERASVTANASVHPGERPDRASSGEVTFEQLFATERRTMLLVALGIVNDVGTAEDVVQDAFTSLYRRWEALREPASARGYLRVSVINGARSVLRRRRTASARVRQTSLEPAEPPSDVSSVLLAEEQAVRAALSALPTRQREVLTLRLLAGLTDQEIAEATGLSYGNVRTAASRGLATLRAALPKDQGDDDE
jgi:RNA polymerase sigma factor (sigma-70 family)